jgi:hypothetical protein
MFEITLLIIAVLTLVVAAAQLYVAIKKEK